MSTKPRTPEHFPRMKHRAAGRIAKQARRMRTTTTLFDAFGVAARIAGEVITTLADRAAAFAEALSNIFTPPLKQSDYVLVPPPLIPSRTFALTEAAPNRAASFMPGDIVTVNNPGSVWHGRVGRVRYNVIDAEPIARIDFPDLYSKLIAHEHLTKGEQK